MIERALRGYAGADRLLEQEETEETEGEAYHAPIRLVRSVGSGSFSLLDSLQIPLWDSLCGMTCTWTFWPLTRTG